jgi:hypothetical protein
MVAKVYAWVAYGMGGAALDPAAGEAYLVRRLKAIGVDTMESPYLWSDLQKIHDAILKIPAAAKHVGGGDSLGANEAPAIAASLPHIKFDFLFGFQRSSWGVQVGVPKNVVNATSIYNPGIIGGLLTLGMGNDPWTLALGNTATHLENIPIYARHPDDWGLAQDIVYNRIKQLAVSHAAPDS